MILGLQIIAIVFALVMCYFAYLHYKKKDLSRDEIRVWIGLWVVVILVVIFPNHLRELARNLFITRLFDFAVVVGFIVVISMVSVMYLRTKKLGNKLEKIIREDALNSLDKKSGRK